MNAPFRYALPLSLSLLAACTATQPEDAAPVPATRAQALAQAPSRGFSCDPLEVRSDTELATVEGAPADALVLRPTGVACRYHLLYRDGSGKQHMLSQSPGMYLLADARVLASAGRPDTTLVCATDLQHARAAVPSDEPGIENRAITSTAVICAAARDGKWSQTNAVVTGGADWAAWVLEAGADEADPDVFWVRWTRDSTFQPLALDDTGRPADDGIYRTRFRLVQGRGPVALDTTKVSDATVEVTVTGEE
ncbi:hypothetical protein FGE12_11490 [Aggregicoccus sp. 17bor-14]|uniref:hypothetical protein n=1 Tax=Myxococcaceae TaxID=31 RepID=UPI00129D18F7|nr:MULTISPECIES: hypothetical protein [Myxococcaceae]MBF5043008.1 hypothetical protein [Simulacricoccus sp. 17bor-14]MRI88773.1 hypothetical protein [Aggregicoccus sp. 17bor-14]